MLGDVPLDKLTAAMLDSAYAKWRAELSGNTVHHLHAITRGAGRCIHGLGDEHCLRLNLNPHDVETYPANRVGSNPKSWLRRVLPAGFDVSATPRTVLPDAFSRGLPTAMVGLELVAVDHPKAPPRLRAEHPDEVAGRGHDVHSNGRIPAQDQTATQPRR